MHRGTDDATGTGAACDLNGAAPDPRASDEALMERVAGGCRDAFALLYERHGAHVHNLCRRVLGGDASAEDAVIDTFLELWRRPQRFDPSRGTLLTYLLLVARSRALDRRRSERAEADRIAREAEDRPRGDATGRAQGPVAPHQELLAAFERLEPRCREAVRLCLVEGLTAEQASRSLRTPVGTIKSRIRKSVIQMREVVRNPYRIP